MNYDDSFKIGLILNPIAGMGGAVGLKGTDGPVILDKARNLGAKPTAKNRCEEFLDELIEFKQKIKIITCPGDMGENILSKYNFKYDVIESPIFDKGKKIFETSRIHTINAANIIKNIEDLKILIFIGGDGTACDILEAINQDIPCLGIPAGVKIYSSVFANNPKVASAIIIQFLWDELPLKEAEVLDIDEEQFRKGKLISNLYGHLIIPFEPNYSQYSKMASPNSFDELNNQERIAKRIIENLEENTYYLLGPGTTIRAITDMLNLEKTLLGIDLLLNRKIIGKDLNESQILAIIDEKKVKIIITPIGHQGFLFGRGNLQFSDKVLKKIGTENIIIVATRYKYNNLARNKMRVDTRNNELDENMRGEYQIIIDYDEMKICVLE
jgi:predicted polyphosphate/ATP-dependent NAD kinase